MDIIEPKRLISLGKFKIHVKIYSDDSAPGLITLDDQYGFTSIADLKHSIWVHKNGNKEFAPSRIFLALEQDDGLLNPIGMIWEETTLSKGVPNPFTNPGIPDSRLVDSQGNQKPVYARLNEGLLLESVFPNKGDVTISLWNIESLIRKIGVQLEQPGVLLGYINLYFPKIKTKEDALESTEEKELFKDSKKFINERNERLKSIDELLSDKKLKTNEPFRLEYLRRWMGIMLKLHDESKSLDMLFYEFKISEDVPFLRYFPIKGRGEPLLKLATGLSGFPFISDKDMLASFLDEEPNTENGPIIIAKIPFSTLAKELTAKKNVGLTIYWNSDGSINISLEAPRRDMLLEVSVLEEAEILLKKALISLGYTEPFGIKLHGLSAKYRIAIKKRKMEKKDLLKNVPFFSPFIEEVTDSDKLTSKLTLKWKAVNNYEQEDAVYNYFTKRILEEDEHSSIDTQEGIHDYIIGAMKKFRRSEEEAKELFDSWYRRREEVMPTKEDPVQAHNVGVDIEIEISHPEYFISFVGIDSEITFQRIISILTAYLYYENTEMHEKIVDVIEPVVNAKRAKPEELKKAIPNASSFMMNLLGEDEDEDEETKTPEQAIVYAPQDAKNQTLEPLKEWYKNQLNKFDGDLFKYSQKDKTVTVYSRTCQASQARQPNVMVAEQLDDLIKDYADEVEWVFLPPPENIILDVQDLKLKELTKLMLEKGFTDIFDERGKTNKKIGELKEIFEHFLCEQPGLQGQFCRILRKKSKETEDDKPIWFVVRAGSNPEKPNYYICARYWCVRDNKPLIPSEFINNKTRQGAVKEPNSCPFCGGKIIEDLDVPQKGQTVIKRKPKEGKSTINEIAGYLSNIHPDKYALPCCFVSPKISEMRPSEGTVPLPKDVRKNQLVNAESDAENDEKDEKNTKDEFENKELTKKLKEIGPKPYILGYDSRQLDSGRIGLCPPQLDEVFGQSGSLSVSKNIGVSQHLNNKAKVFLRFGLGNKASTPGLSFLQLVGFYLGNLQRAGKPPVKGAKLDMPTVYTAQGVLNLLLPEKPTDDDLKFIVNLRRAFERANYGNLVHEFAGNSNKLTQSQYEQFAKEQEFDTTTNPSLRPQVVRLANAWYNFVNYIKDENSQKELRHFENLFACPNVLFPEGLIPIIFEGTPDKDNNMVINIKCPEYGVSEFSKAYKPPLAFIFYDKISNVYEPIIYVEATSKKDKKDKSKFVVLSSFHESDPKFTTIDSTVQNSVSDFIKQFLSFDEGCGRYSNPPHPWMPDLSSSSLPRLSQLTKLKLGADLGLNYVLRDRSNRLVGVLIKTTQSDIPVYIPCLEDGSLGLQLKSLYDTQSLPLPPLGLILNLLTGKGPLSKIPGLKPSEILYNEKDHKFCALRLSSNAIIPFAKFSNKDTDIHPVFNELMAKGAKPIVLLPWEEDIRFLSQGYDVVESGMTIVKDTIVEEGYNYLRISLSEWLANKEGAHTRKQLKGLKESDLPLYEKRRRGDILLEPLIHNWLDTSEHTQAIPEISLLRRNCIVEKSKDSCVSPMCSWISDTCKIHTGTSEAIPNIKVYFVSRIIDEIMRYSNKANEILNNTVSKIGTPIGIVRTADGILTSKSKTQELSDDLDLDYIPKDGFSLGLTYPEDVHDDDFGKSLRPELIDLPIEWKKVGLSRLAANLIEDRMKLSLMTHIEGSYDKLQKSLLKLKNEIFKSKEPINWSQKDLYCLAKFLSTDLIITRFDGAMVKIAKWIRADENATKALIVFYANESPEVLLYTKSQIDKKDLPKVFELYFESHAPLLLEQIN